jgi:hypothetical protein
MKIKVEVDIEPYTLDDYLHDLQTAEAGYCVACGKITDHELRDKHGEWIFCCWDSEDACKNKIRKSHLEL